MYRKTFPTPVSRWDQPLGALLGFLFSVMLFVAMSLAQMMAEVQPPIREIDEQVVVFEVPKVEEIEEEQIAALEEEEPPPELLSESVPDYSLDQLDVALNPGVGVGSIVGDFSMPRLGESASAPETLESEDFVAFADLDRTPRPLHGAHLSFPMRLRRREARGTIVLHLRLGPDGRVLETEIASSDLPAFDAIVVDQVASWQFTPPTRQGKPVYAEARFPIPIRIE